MHKNGFRKLNSHINSKKTEKLAEMNRELSVEREKRLEILNMEIRTEEYKRRQEMISEYMQKKAELDFSFKDEKKRYFKELREEMLKNSELNRGKFEAEMERIAKNWRLN